MRRTIVHALAALGALGLLFGVLGFVSPFLGWTDATIVVVGEDDESVAGVPVFLDRGHLAIERYTTDAEGRLRLPLERDEYRRAVWLICSPGAIPMIGDRGPGQYGPTTYGVSPLRDSTLVLYRARGWRGPIPRECPQATDTMGWRYPPSAGMNPHAFTTTEPVWPDR